ncbi:hypothetical protein B5181_32180 [Streptomyces sp. 4F]|nr:hypothetical protein B5181_32180 [Streptomyces sp. 4F]
MASELPFSRSDSRGPGRPGFVPARPAETARWCAGQGWPVHPLSPGRKTPVANCARCRAPGHDHRRCPCLSAGRWCHGFRAATLDRTVIERWWGGEPRLVVGVDVDDDQPRRPAGDAHAQRRLTGPGPLCSPSGGASRRGLT